MPERDVPEIDGALTTWEGASREKLRRWRELTLEEILRAREEMWDLAVALGHDPGCRVAASDAGDANASSGEGCHERETDSVSCRSRRKAAVTCFRRGLPVCVFQRLRSSQLCAAPTASPDR